METKAKKTFLDRLKEVGPGALVAAAFIGPGTVTSCFTSGANFGYTLLWAMLFSVISVIVMQTMAAKLGIVQQKGLGETLRDTFPNKVARVLLAILVISAVFIGNVAYETGNITGSVLGAQTVFSGPAEAKGDADLTVTNLSSVTVSAGSPASFGVTASGGKSPYTYQWQYRTSSDGSWENSEEETAVEATMKISEAREEWNGYQYRCVVTGADGSAVESAATTLKVGTDVLKIVFALIIGVVAAVLLASGSYKYIEKILTGIVVIMGVLFLICAIFAKPAWGEVLKGMFVPTVPSVDKAWMTVAALMGTTVVPYNIYLHASSAAKKWKNPESDLRTSLLDSVIAIGLGGIISMAIIICASAVISSLKANGSAVDIADGRKMAVALTPLLGSWATSIFGIGLFAAGFTSAITAPLSAAFASSGILGWGEDMKKWRFKIIWAIVLLFGVVAACTLGKSPQEIILFAQAANAFLLPITAVLLLVVSNNKKVMGKYRNGIILNILAVIVIAVFIFIAARNMTAFVTSVKALF